MKKEILITDSEKKYLRDLFGCSRVAIWKALTYESNSSTAQKIRKVAIERGGKLAGVNYSDFETTFQTTEKTMTQTFGDRVKIVVYMEQNLTIVLVDDQIRVREKNLSIPEFMELQEKAKKISLNNELL